MLKKIILVFLLVALFPSSSEARALSPFGTTDITYKLVWSKDSSRIYYIKTVEHVVPTWAFAGASEKIGKLECYIMSMRPDGSGKKVITEFITKEGSLKSIDNLAISPDEKQLVFSLSHRVEGGESGVYRIDADGKDLTKIVDSQFVISGTTFFISPDGKK